MAARRCSWVILIRNQGVDSIRSRNRARAVDSRRLPPAQVIGFPRESAMRSKDNPAVFGQCSSPVEESGHRFACACADAFNSNPRPAEHRMEFCASDLICYAAKSIRRSLEKEVQVFRLEYMECTVQTTALV